MPTELLLLFLDKNKIHCTAWRKMFFFPTLALSLLKLICSDFFSNSFPCHGCSVIVWFAAFSIFQFMFIEIWQSKILKQRNNCDHAHPFKYSLLCSRIGGESRHALISLQIEISLQDLHWLWIFIPLFLMLSYILGKFKRKWFCRYVHILPPHNLFCALKISLQNV